MIDSIIKKKSKRNIIRVAVILVITACSCGMLINPKKQEDMITGIKFTMDFPLFDTNWNLKKYDTVTHFLYYYNNQTACNFSYHFLSVDSIGNEVSELRHFYFIYTKDEKYGLLIDSNQTVRERKASVDSILKIYWPEVKVDPALSEEKNFVSLVSEENDRVSGILTQEYRLKDKIDTNMNASLLLKYSTEMKGIGYTFSNRLDSINQKKLFYYKMTFEPRFIYLSKKWISGFDVMCTFEELLIKNKSEQLDLFNKETTSKIK